jgi:uncharacterized protein YecT (DUF1311 family)
VGVLTSSIDFDRRLPHPAALAEGGEMEVTRVAAVIGGLMLLTSLCARRAGIRRSPAQRPPPRSNHFCAEQDFKAADARLNAAYKAMLGASNRHRLRRKDESGPARRRHQDAQRKWLAFGMPIEGGVGAKDRRHGYELRRLFLPHEKTAARTRELEARSALRDRAAYLCDENANVTA